MRRVNSLNKIFVQLFFICFIPVVIICLYTCNLTTKVMFEHMEKSTLLDMLEADEQISEFIDNTEQTVQLVIEKQEIFKNFFDSINPENEIEQFFDEYFEKNQVVGCVLLTEDGEYIYGFDKLLVDTTWIQVSCGLGNEPPGKIKWYNMNGKNVDSIYKDTVVAGMSFAQEDTTRYGSIYLFLSNNYFEDIMRSMINKKNLVVFMDDSGKQFMINDSEKWQDITRSSKEMILELYKEEQGYFSFRNSSKRYITAHYTSRKTGFKVFEVYDKIEFYREIYQVIVVIGILMAFFFIAISRIFYHVRKQYLIPLNMLKNEMSGINDSTLAEKLEIHGGDEINLIISQYNDMLNRLHTIIAEVRVAEEKKREAEIETMRYQINPHFLYNTLSSMKIIAISMGVPEIGDSISKLAEMFKYMLSYKSNLVKFRDEVEFIKNYTSLMNIRYGNRLSVDFLIGDGLEEVRVPIFLLQPLVENSISHGLQKRLNEGKISIVRIEAVSSGEYLLIKIRDNGIGMTEDTINELLNVQLEEFSHKKIGLRNVITRLRLLYCDNFHFNVESKPGEYTTIVIKLPKD